MSEVLKKALFDTDFLFKCHLAQNKQRDPLIDKVIGFEGYEFFIHEKIMEELSDHGFDPDPVPWLEKKIEQGVVKKYTDADIIDGIESVLEYRAPSTYFDFLKTSCEAFENFPFELYYQNLIALPEDIGKEEFLHTLKLCDQEIPNGNSMGEKKSYVLAQLLELKYPGKVVVLCSDDGGARRRLAYIRNGIKGFSVLATFQKLKQCGLDEAVARQYYDSLCSFYSLRNQKAMKVWKNRGSERISVDFDELFRDLYNGRFEIKSDGDLRYISDKEK